MTLKKKLLIIVIVEIAFYSIAISFSNYQERKRDYLNKEYFENFNESFEGRVTSVTNQFDVHSCMLRVDLDKSTTNAYDKRNETDDYYVVIKDDKAEILERIKYAHNGTTEPFNLFSEGDYFVFNGQSDSAYLYRQNQLIYKWKPLLGTFDFFGSKGQLREKHKL